MSTRKIRLVFVGLGGMGQVAHLRNYALHRDVEVAAVAELRTRQGAQVAARYGVSKVYRDHHELFEHESHFDGIVAIQPFTIHGSLIPELAKRDVPVLIEKPLARGVEAGEMVAGCARSGGIPIYVAYHKRSDPAVMCARRIISEWKQSGEFGRLKYVRITMPPGPWPAPRTGFDSVISSDEPYPDLPGDPIDAGLDSSSAGRLEAFVNYYIHQVNLMRHLMDEDYRVTYADPAGVVLAVNSTSGGISGIIEMEPYRSTVDWQEEALVTFEKGWIRIRIPGPLALDAAGSVTVYRDSGDGSGPERLSPSLAPVHAMRQQADHFVDAIRGKPTPLCEAEEALKDLVIARDWVDLSLSAVPAT